MKHRKDINNVHDKSYKHLLSSKDIFEDLIKSFVNKSWSKDITKENLERVDKSFILSDYEELESDILYKAKIGEEEVMFYILLEMQSTPDYSMPIRLYMYMGEIWRDHLKNFTKKEVKRKDFKLPAIIPIVLYNGAYV
ncbi:MAG: Rpn family recombination-promoting nuclease/putative transposase [Clostridium sp.]